MTTKTPPTYPEQIEKIRAGFPENARHRAHGLKLRREESAKRRSLDAKDREIRETAAADLAATAEEDVSDLLLGGTSSVLVDAGPTVAQLESERDAISADLHRHRQAIPQQDELTRGTAGPVGRAVAEAMQPRHDKLKRRGIKACEELAAVAVEMSQLYNALQAAGFTCALGNRVGPPSLRELEWWLREAKKDLGT